MNRYVYEEDNFFSFEECEKVLKLAEGIGYEEAKIRTRSGDVMDKSIRNNSKAEFENDELNNLLVGRLSKYDEVVNGFPGFEFNGVNELFRVYKYGEGQEFKTHVDGRYTRNEEEHSKITVLVYLNDANEEFGGGETEFVMPHRVVVPEAGKLLLFAHRQLHKGNMVTDGFKYVLRTDIMYKVK